MDFKFQKENFIVEMMPEKMINLIVKETIKEILKALEEIAEMKVIPLHPRVQVEVFILLLLL